MSVVAENATPERTPEFHACDVTPKQTPSDISWHLFLWFRVLRTGGDRPYDRGRLSAARWRPLVRQAWKALSIALATLAVACGDSTGPSADLTGAWGFSASNLSGGGVSCNVSGVTLTLTQSNGSFSGSYSSGTLACTGPGGSFSDTFSGGIVVNGSISSTGAVTFNLDTSDFQLTGTVSGNSMSGTATIRVDFGAPTGVVTLSGNWGASRQ